MVMTSPAHKPIVYKKIQRFRFALLNMNAASDQNKMSISIFWTWWNFIWPFWHL